MVESDDDGAPIRPDITAWEKSPIKQNYTHQGFQKGKLVHTRRNTKQSIDVDVGGCDASPSCLTCKAEVCVEVDIATNVKAIREKLLASATQLVQKVEPLETVMVEPLENPLHITVQHSGVQRSVDAYSTSDNFRQCRCGAQVNKYTDKCPRCGEYL